MSFESDICLTWSVSEFSHWSQAQGQQILKRRPIRNSENSVYSGTNKAKSDELVVIVSSHYKEISLADQE